MKYEQIEINNSIESREENCGVKIGYKFTGVYGEAVTGGEGESEGFELNIPEEARYFDGTIYTKFGIYAIQDTTDKAKLVIDKIKSYGPTVSELEKLNNEIPKLENEERYYSPQGTHEDFDRWSEIRRSISAKEGEKRGLEGKIKEINKIIDPYFIQQNK